MAGFNQLPPDQLNELVKLQFPSEQQQFNMTAPENLMPVSPSQPQPTPQRMPATQPVQPEPMPQLDPLVVQTLKKKYGLLNPEEYDQQLKAAQDEASERKKGLGWAQFAAGMGDALAGRDPSNSAKNFQAIRQNIDEKTVGKLEARRKAQMDLLSANTLMDKSQREADAYNPQSQQSQAFRKIIESRFPDVARAYGPNWQNVSAADQDLIFKPLQLKEQIEARKETARILAQQHNDARTERILERREKESKLSDKQVESVTDIDTALGDLKNIRTELGEHSEWTGPIDGRTPNLLVGEDQAAWRSAIGKYKDQYRKAITGTGASPGEIARLEGRLPSETDTYAQFVSKGEEAERDLQRRKQIQLDNLNKQGKNVTAFRSEPALSSRFPMTLRKDGHTATVSNEAELKEARAEGWR